tara:strand:- start:967 stop:1098 length:132 start_codon:yes stop_codon:yes gene_type:complete
MTKSKKPRKTRKKAKKTKPTSLAKDLKTIFKEAGKRLLKSISL